jgi:hypothetical protein
LAVLIRLRRIRNLSGWRRRRLVARRAGLLSGGLLIRAPAGLLRGIGVSSSDFLINLSSQIVQFALGHAQGFGVVAQHALGRVFDALFQVFDVFPRALLELSRLIYEIPL